VSFDFVERYYGRSFYRGQQVVCTDGARRERGLVVKATHYVYVLVDGERHARPWHPADVEPVTAQNVEASS